MVQEHRRTGSATWWWRCPSHASASQVFTSGKYEVMRVFSCRHERTSFSFRRDQREPQTSALARCSRRQKSGDRLTVAGIGDAIGGNLVYKREQPLVLATLGKTNFVRPSALLELARNEILYECPPPLGSGNYAKHSRMSLP